jgi:hypothetical protein
MHSMLARLRTMWTNSVVAPEAASQRNLLPQANMLRDSDAAFVFTAD